MTAMLGFISLLATLTGLSSTGTPGQAGAVRPGARQTYCDPTTGCANRTVIFANTARSLFSIDVSGSTPRVTHVGDFGAEITDVAGTPDGRMFAVSFRMLYRVDPTTGRATVVGPLGVGNVNGLTASGQALVASSTDGFLYNIDTTTGQASLVGGFGQGLTSSGDVCFGPGGALYMTSPQGSGRTAVDRLVRIDRATGAAATVGSTGHARVYGLAWAGVGLVGVTESGLLVRLDPATGGATVLGQGGAPFWGAF